MNIVVCLKQVLDPEAPAENFSVDTQNNTVKVKGEVNQVINPFDENAIEAAVQIKEQTGATITAITLGNKADEEVLKKAMAIGADQAILLSDQLFGNCDAFVAANALAAAIKKINNVDLVLCGRESGDWGSGLVGAGLAQQLGFTLGSVAVGLECMDSGVKLRRISDDGFLVVDLPLPAVVSVSNEINKPRIPTVRGVLAARKAKITVWNAADLGIEEKDTGAKVTIKRLFEPFFESNCQFIQGESPEEMGELLADLLRSKKVI